MSATLDSLELLGNAKFVTQEQNITELIVFAISDTMEIEMNASNAMNLAVSVLVLKPINVKLALMSL